MHGIAWRTSFAFVCYLLLGLPSTLAQDSAAFYGSKFFRRAYQSSVIVGDHFYLDGGIIEYHDPDDTTQITYSNATYSIPLIDSWQPQDVAFTRTGKDDSIPRLIVQNIWATDNVSFYSFNGAVGGEAYAAGFRPESSTDLWRFNTDGVGGGSWVLDSVTPASISQSFWTGSTTGNGSQWFLGGLHTAYTTPQITDNTWLSADGMISYNMTTQTWLNQTDHTMLDPRGWWWNLQLHYLTGLGNQGLLLAMGGITAPPSSDFTHIGDMQTQKPYNNVAIYNTVTDQWVPQATSAENEDDRPQPRGAPCSVGVAGDNGTFEVCHTLAAIHSPPPHSTHTNIIPDFLVRWVQRCLLLHPIASQHRPWPKSTRPLAPLLHLVQRHR